MVEAHDAMTSEHKSLWREVWFPRKSNAEGEEITGSLMIQPVVTEFKYEQRNTLVN